MNRTAASRSPAASRCCSAIFWARCWQACKARELHTAVDTSGFATWDTLDRIRPLTDLFLYDLKLIDDERHREFTGVTNQPILRNLRDLSALGHAIVIRIPIVPGINDDDESIQQLAEFIAALPNRHPIDLLPVSSHRRRQVPAAG